MLKTDERTKILASPNFEFAPFVITTGPSLPLSSQVVPLQSGCFPPRSVGIAYKLHLRGERLLRRQECIKPR